MRERHLSPLTPQQEELLDQAVESITESTPSFQDAKDPVQAWRRQYRLFAAYLMQQGKTLEEINQILGQRNPALPTKS